MINGTPDIVTHNSSEQDFTLTSTQDVSYFQTYTVTVTATISVPNNNSPSPPLTEIEADLSFDIVVDNPCSISDMAAFTIDDMTTSILGTA